MNRVFGVAYQEKDQIGFRDIWFSKYKDFEEYILEKEDPHFYEIIEGKQCLYFDFDGLEKIKESEFKEIVFQIKEKIKDDILINLYDSSGYEKVSHHIVVKGVYFQNHDHCGSIAKEIISKLSDESNLKKSFDDAIYTSRRNFRLLGSRKKGSVRVKKFAKVLYKDENFSCSFLNDFLRMSLINDIKESKEILLETNKEFQLSDDMSTDQNKKETRQIEWKHEDLLEIDKFINSELDSAFRRNGFGGGCLNLLRQKPSKCPICKDKKGGKRVHDNENSYIIKTKDGLYYICRRASPTERIKIGSEHEEDWTFEYKPKKIEENSNESEKLRLLKKIKNYFSFD